MSGIYQCAVYIAGLVSLAGGLFVLLRHPCRCLALLGVLPPAMWIMGKIILPAIVWPELSPRVGMAMLALTLGGAGVGLGMSAWTTRRRAAHDMTRLADSLVAQEAALREQCHKGAYR